MVPSVVCRPQMTSNVSRRCARQFAAEAVGTAMLLAAVVGSGIMGERLSGGNVAIALLASTIATENIMMLVRHFR